MNKLISFGVFTCICLAVNAQIIQTVGDKLSQKAGTMLDKKADQILDNAASKSSMLLEAIYLFNNDSLPTPRWATVQALRNDLLKDGKWQTGDIAFDPTRENPDPGSMGVLKEMATLLYENSEMRLKIVGSPGATTQQGLDSSMAMAASIKLMLMNQFGIDPGRLLIDAKPATVAGGSNMPTPNSRKQVIFIKL